MTSLARILLAAGLLVAVVTAAPQQPSHPQSSAQSPNTETPSRPSFSQPHDSEDSSKDHEAEDTQNDDSTTISPTRLNPQSPFSGIHRQTRGVTPQVARSNDSDEAITTTEKPQRFNPGLSFGVTRETRGVSPQSAESDDDTATTTQGTNFHPLSSFSNTNSRHTRSSTFPEQAPISPHSEVPVSSFSQGGSTGVNSEAANPPPRPPVDSQPDSAESHD